jgi:hypothetical protein
MHQHQYGMLLNLFVLLFLLGLLSFFGQSIILLLLFFHDRIEWAVRGLSFGCQSQLLALASEDPYIEIAKVDTGRILFAFNC